MDAHVSPSRVAGRARAPPSKSYTHRAILAAGYGEGTVVRDPLDSADPHATGRAVEAFGGDVEWDDDASAVRVDGFAGRPETPEDVVDCGNSGTTMRLVTATGGLAGGLVVLTGDGSLRSRPQGPLLDAVTNLGGRAESTRGNGQAPLVVGGAMSGGSVAIPGDVSSQFVSALLMAGAVTNDGIEVELETELKSAPYVEITRELLADFGVDTERTDAGFRVPGGQTYRADEYAVPGDFSSMSYLLAAGALAAEDGETLTVEGARPSAQGDSAIVEILDRMGADIDWDRDAGEIGVGRAALSGVEVDVGDTPDLLPTIAVLGAAADGDTRIVNAEHVRYKETDRVAAMAEELGEMGASVTEEPDSLTVHGDDSDLRGATVDGRGDHRLVMALAVAGLVADGETKIRGAEHVEVSFPGFFETLADLGAEALAGGWP
ncbi:3-phosphoshikimate 1-carboxyvinyltransferase [Candidatus Halobonum tyrrellensis]|uniref:3-phosphoshikimate 1-carboxyvinyltransferase n=1 Tax=Candidatus Halobonum tyrrellensis G22 TaxID=1324957 RepID=V4GU69_9EURY|nr:3-phosphoshikimate 1-carboxyvinyltransferase [Candidatus Halobonum tyrrellensis]ESP88676.1 3-phosphoshikimate 1-carboxyvinyltransferase [Candidatus Halobonum tyrrellensis G22]